MTRLRSFRRLRPLLAGGATLLGIAALLVIPASAAAAATVVVDLQAPASASANTVIPISVSYSCSGNEDCEDVTVVLTAGGALGTDSVTCDLGTVATGSSSGLTTCTISLSFPGSTPDGATGTITASATLSNGSGNSVQRTISADNPGGGVPDTTTTTTTTPQTTTTTTPPAPEPGIWIDKSKNDGSLFPGQVFEYRFTVRNTGDYALTNVVVTDELPAEFVYSSPSASNGGAAVLDGNDLTITWASLAIGQQVTATVEVTVVYPAPI